MDAKHEQGHSFRSGNRRVNLFERNLHSLSFDHGDIALSLLPQVDASGQHVRELFSRMPVELSLC